jgi:hypothetical protein
LLRYRKQTVALCCDRNATSGVCMHHTADIWSRLMDGAVNDEPCRVNKVFRVMNGCSSVIYLDKTGGRNLVKEHAVRVDQKVLRRIRNPSGYVRKDEVIPSKVSDQTVCRSKFDTHIPFRVRDIGGPGAWFVIYQHVECLHENRMNLNSDWATVAHRKRTQAGRTQSQLPNGDYMGQPWAQGVGDILGGYVAVQMAKRWLVKNSTAWENLNRRRLKSCEPLLNTRLQFVHLACLRLWLRSL